MKRIQAYALSHQFQSAKLICRTTALDKPVSSLACLWTCPSWRSLKQQLLPCTTLVQTALDFRWTPSIDAPKRSRRRGLPVIGAYKLCQPKNIEDLDQPAVGLPAFMCRPREGAKCAEHCCFVRSRIDAVLLRCFPGLGHFGVIQGDGPPCVLSFRSKYT
jgi:hypothetical protein